MCSEQEQSTDPNSFAKSLRHVLDMANVGDWFKSEVMIPTCGDFMTNLCEVN
jgi:hypothetical protein